CAASCALKSRGQTYHIGGEPTLRCASQQNWSRIGRLGSRGGSGNPGTTIGQCPDRPKSDRSWPVPSIHRETSPASSLQLPGKPGAKRAPHDQLFVLRGQPCRDCVSLNCPGLNLLTDLVDAVHHVVDLAANQRIGRGRATSERHHGRLHTKH